MGVSYRRVWLGGIGGLAATHVLGCASTGTAAIGRTHHSEPRPPSPETREPPEPSVVEPVAPVPAPIHRSTELSLPARASDAESGSAFLERAEGYGRGQMDDAIVDAILAGNVPNYVRHWTTLTFDAEGHSLSLDVTNDYLAVGTDEDFVRMPMTAAAAQRIADKLDASLPTRKLVDLIYTKSVAKLPPSYIDGGPTDGTLSDYAVHQEKLENRRLARGFPLGVLTAGHKKDIVLSERLVEHPDSVCIYGWHVREGEVIQSLSTRHSRRYADYSHGVRLIGGRMQLDGRAHRVSEVLSDAEFAHLLCDEGPLSITAYPTTLPVFAGKKKTTTPRKIRSPSAD